MHAGVHADFLINKCIAREHNHICSNGGLKMFEQIRACLDGQIRDQDACEEIFLNSGIMAELEAINLYNTIASKTKNSEIKQLMQEISDEERMHVGEFQSLLHKLKPETYQLEKQGEEERIVKIKP